MEQIIEPVAAEAIERELTPERILRRTQNGSNVIYAFHATECPQTMREIGRLREIAFRDAGGGTGKDYDVDADDLAQDGYLQLIVWNPDDREIIGGYRYIVSTGAHPAHLSTEHYFRFTDKFREEYLPYMIELGRSFVQPKYQSRQGGVKSLYALDNLWDGLGVLAFRYKHVKYFFGKVTMYTHYLEEARIDLLYFLKKYFADKEGLVEPILPYELNYDRERMTQLFCGANYHEDYKILVREVKRLGEQVPPLINAYMNLSPTMKVFDTVVNPDFGGVLETGILVTLGDIYEEKIERYIKSLAVTEGK